MPLLAAPGPTLECTLSEEPPGKLLPEGLLPELRLPEEPADDEPEDAPEEPPDPSDDPPGFDEPDGVQSLLSARLCGDIERSSLATP